MIQPTVIDFETVYLSQRGGSYSLRDVTVPAYVSDPRFAVHGVAVKEPGQGARWISNHQVSRCSFAEAVESVISRATSLVSHNAQFDDYITQHALGIKHSLPVYCTLFLANGTLGPRSVSGLGNDLGSLAERLSLSSLKGELGFMNGLRVPSPEEKERLARYAMNDANLCAQIFERLLPLLSNRETELALISHTVRMFTSPDRQAGVDLPRVESVLSSLSADLGRVVVPGFDVHAAKPVAFEAEMGRRLAAVGEALPTKTTDKGNKKSALAKRDAAFVLLCAHKDPGVSSLARAWQEKKEILHEIDKLQTIRDQAPAGRIPIRLTYHGAVTGRWTGSGGMNIQNLGRGSEVRRVFVAKPGRTLIIADLSRIELCVLALLAGQDDLVSSLREGQDVYSLFATGAFGREVRKPKETDTPEDQERLGKDRTAGKICVLQLGYGAGSRSLAAELTRNKVEADAEMLVARYRETYPEIKVLWKRLEADAARALGGVSVTTGPSAGCTWTFKMEDRDLTLVLPSGRVIRYPNARQQKLSSWPWTRLSYGPGSGYTLDQKALAENLCSGTARDVLAGSLVRLEQDKIPVLWSVHDELVCEVPLGMPWLSSHVKSVMSDVPSWLPGLPLDVEVLTSERYEK